MKQDPFTTAGRRGRRACSTSRYCLSKASYSAFVTRISSSTSCSCAATSWSSLPTSCKASRMKTFAASGKLSMALGDLMFCAVTRFFAGPYLDKEVSTCTQKVRVRVLRDGEGCYVCCVKLQARKSRCAAPAVLPEEGALLRRRERPLRRSLCLPIA